MSDDVAYGKLTKRIVFVDTDHRHAQLILRLKHDKINQADFFRGLVTGYIENDERICSYVEQLSGLSLKRKAKSRQLRKTGRALKEKASLSAEDVRDIFDLIAEEHPEL